MDDAMDEEAPGRWDGWVSPRVWAPLGAVLVAGLILSLALWVREVRGDSDSAPAAGGSSVLMPGELRQPVHEHADFALFIRGERFDFSRQEFLSDDGGEELSSNVHIHNPRFTVVHVHREQTTWDEFFTSLGFQLTDNCVKVADIAGGQKYCESETEKLRFFVNGVEIDSLMFQDISDLDRVLITFGSETDAQVQAQMAQVTDQACIPSQLCAARFPPGGLEKEHCSKADTTCQ